jgi:hypothetical protein
VNRLLALVFGVVYPLVGLLGFAVTSGVGFAATEGCRCAPPRRPRRRAATDAGAHAHPHGHHGAGHHGD